MLLSNSIARFHVWKKYQAIEKYIFEFVDFLKRRWNNLSKIYIQIEE